MADAAVAPSKDDLLAAVSEVSAKLDTTTGELNELLERRRDLFARLREIGTPLGEIRRAANLGSNEAVAAVLRRARSGSTKGWRTPAPEAEHD